MISGLEIAGADAVATAEVLFSYAVKIDICIFEESHTLKHISLFSQTFDGRAG